MKSITIILLSLISTLGFSQSDSISYQYRIGIKDVTSIGSSLMLQEPLTYLFKTKISYQEQLNTFIFESKEDVDEREVSNLLALTSYTVVTYFKKIKLVKFDEVK